MNKIAPLLAAATSCFALTMAASADHFTFRTIVKTGDPVPQVGGTFTDFAWPRINNAGQIAFAAARTGELATAGIWFTPVAGESMLESVAMSNLQAPGATAGITFDQFDIYQVRPQINEAGNLAITLPLSGLPYDNANGVFRYIDGELTMVAIAGDVVPDIGGDVMYREFASSIGFNDNDLTAFGALLTGPGVTAANDATVYMQWFGGLTQVKRESAVAPPQGFGWTWGTNSTNMFPDSLPLVQIANDGRVGFDSRVNTAMGTVVSRWTGWPAMLSHGTMAGNLSPQGLPFINDQNAGPYGTMLTEDGFAFVHKVDDGGETRTGVWRRTGNSIETIALEGAPGPLGTYAYIQEFSAIAAYDGTVAWPATFDLPDEETDTAILVKRPGEAPTVLLREGDTPPRP